MNAATYKAIKAVLGTDDTVTKDQARSALAILQGRVPDSGPLPLLLTQKQAAHLLGVSRFTVRKMTQEGKLHPVQVHERRHYRRTEIEAIANGEGESIAAKNGSPPWPETGRG